MNPRLGLIGVTIVSILSIVLGAAFERQRVARQCAEQGAFERNGVLYVCTLRLPVRYERAA